MPTPPKPFEVLTSERKSHRTKAELEKRKAGEEALCSGKALKERSEVRDNPIAHREFARINNVLKNIKKNDALYEAIINRYCILYSECMDFERKRDIFYHDLQELENAKQELIDNEEMSLSTYFKRKLDMHKTILSLEATIQSKRKMLLDIEKENIMTIASALRSIPKKVENKEDDDPMDALLKRQRRN